ncbi:guanylate kinase [Sporothrix brasiliensis 5110]|uniref:Guanylate kinase n=1 Tax=Sporothrix brasiliensis 5110 TaxID=1398154 RepID=A0A0C2IUT4_9PEZI|nr:guanylate kinase [Sporothrix brasiliensis 5110]KIH88747.1 guanylate kinase [Sporothrix brasiliensis 5110]
MAVSHTTREPRPGEVHGASYYYISRDEFARLIGAEAFIEHAEFNGNLYGTSKQTVEDQAAKGSIVVLGIEMEGVKQPKRIPSAAQGDVDYRFIFVRPPDFATLESRLRGRGTEDEASRRPACMTKVVVNNDLDAAYKELHDFVFRKADHGGKDA